MKNSLLLIVVLLALHAYGKQVVLFGLKGSYKTTSVFQSLEFRSSLRHPLDDYADAVNYDPYAGIIYRERLPAMDEYDCREMAKVAELYPKKNTSNEGRYCEVKDVWIKKTSEDDEGQSFSLTFDIAASSRYISSTIVEFTLDHDFKVKHSNDGSMERRLKTYVDALRKTTMCDTVLNIIILKQFLHPKRCHLDVSRLGHRYGAEHALSVMYEDVEELSADDFDKALQYSRSAY